MTSDEFADFCVAVILCVVVAVLIALPPSPVAVVGWMLCLGFAIYKLRGIS